jgi:hypothetical protein
VSGVVRSLKVAYPTVGYGPDCSEIKVQNTFTLKERTSAFHRLGGKMHNPNEFETDNEPILETIGGEKLTGSGFEAEAPDPEFPSREYSRDSMTR